jgi:hypothetical protein
MICLVASSLVAGFFLHDVHPAKQKVRIRTMVKVIEDFFTQLLLEFFEIGSVDRRRASDPRAVFHGVAAELSEAPFGAKYL